MLEVQNVSHWYGERQVLKDVSFTVSGGHLTGFVGANGAGKTTTMRTILGLVRPRAGQVLLDGKPITDADRALFGYMPEERGLYPKMKVLEQIVFFAELHGVRRDVATRRATDLLERLELGERANDNVESLSLGNQQRAQICTALVHRPDFLMLDEPFSGLDPVAVDVVLAALQEEAARGVPVLFSSHQLDVVERLSDELVIISQGEIRATGSRQALQEQHSRGMYRLDADDTQWLGEQPDVEVVDRDAAGTVVRISAADDAAAEQRAQELLREAVARGPVRRFNRELTPLAQIFREVR
ncbi:ABC transporter ATP-binding protein [Gulosibacter faecalis]|uniref:ABC transporter ATP-binding protein n=1 Tax=Gulosibacter faecalis TaxID=272240 RepID=A0ABW5UVR0_9MICO|nr:ATP-binding cassette domain-containing protein [Gulosibacter faecalis]